MNGHRPRHRRRLLGASSAVALAIAAALVGATTSLGGGGGDPAKGDKVLGKAGDLRYFSDAERFDPMNGGYAASSVGCSSEKRHVTGGGVEATGPRAGSTLVVTNPLDWTDGAGARDDGWNGAGFGAAGKRLLTYSICAREGEFRYRHKEAADAMDPDRFAHVDCGGESWQVIGGGAFIASSGSWINATYPDDGDDPDSKPDDGWTAWIHDGAGGIGGMSVDAVCIRSDEVRYPKDEVNGVPAGSSTSATAECPGDRHVTGGGIFVSGSPSEARLARSYPDDGPDSNDVPAEGWVGAFSNDSGSSKDATVRAICLA